MVEMMVAEFGSDPGQLLVGIAPSAGPCCYEVDDLVYSVARNNLDDADACFTQKGDKFMFDLWKANQQQLVNSGVSPENIETAGLCTICDQRFWSYRCDGDTAGRFAMFASLR
jgi:copper oxidase (laccase) domain-containing protein